jgi:hypothetical protein
MSAPRRDLYPRRDFAGSDAVGGGSLLSQIQKEILPQGHSVQGSLRGLRPHPFDFATLQSLKDFNEHHSTCLGAKISATVGLGFLNDEEKKKRQMARGLMAPMPTMPGEPSRGDAPVPSPAVPVGASTGQIPLYKPSRIDEILDPLTTNSLHDVLMDVCEDYWDTGNGYIEVVRDGNKITGLHHLPSLHTFVHVDDDKHNYHFLVRGENSHDRHFAAFGDKEDFLRRRSQPSTASEASAYAGISGTGAEMTSEVIHFRRPSARSKWYGALDWACVVPMIELCQMLHQYKFDFFNNRGVPEFMLFITGAKVSKDEWTVIEKAMASNIGHGNSHKSFAMNLPQKDMTIQIEKLALDSGSDEDFRTLKETIALSIVTGHRVPPLLAGIQIPGKLGAANELSQALIAFQALVIGQAQRQFEKTLIKTLCSNGSGLGLTPEDCVLKAITDELDPQTMDTIGRMHQPLPQANAEGRDINQGVKD